MTTALTFDRAWEIVRKYNKEPFLLRHAYTVSCVMGYFADELGFSDEKEYWRVVGVLHDLDFELHPDEHCKKTPELMRENGVEESVIRSAVSHGYTICSDVEPQHTMEKVLFATDELTGLIYACALIRPTKNVQDMELKSLKKKFKTLAFAAGCSRDIIEKGSVMLGWELDELLERTLEAYKAVEADIETFCAERI